MKWRKRSITCSLLAGLTALIYSGCSNQPSVRLVSSKTLEFPSASGLAFYRDTLFVFGDNATHLLLLSRDYEPFGRYRYWNSNEPVIEKEDKPDIESALVVERKNHSVLIGVGSMSGKKRWNNFELIIGDTVMSKSQFFGSETVFPGIEDINIEGSTAFGKQILFCNRANLKTKKNHLLFWNSKDSVFVKEIDLPETKGVAGLSGLCYVPEKDLLLFTASEEATMNAYDDGVIGESYIGWITNFSNESKNDVIKTGGFVKLSGTDIMFEGQKIESVCVEKQQGNVYLLHLAADNDNGKSVLFKVELTL